MTPEKIAELRSKVKPGSNGWCVMPYAHFSDLLSLAERAVEAEKLAASGKDSLNVTYGMLLSARQAREVAESRVQSLEAELRVAREALGRVENESDDQVVVDIARETLAKIGGGNE